MPDDDILGDEDFGFDDVAPLGPATPSDTVDAMAVAMGLERGWWRLDRDMRIGAAPIILNF